MDGEDDPAPSSSGTHPRDVHQADTPVGTSRRGHRGRLLHLLLRLFRLDDLEVGFVDRMLVGYYNSVNPGARWTAAAPADHRLDRIPGAFENCFDRTVRTVGYPTRHRQAGGLPPARVTIEDALDSAGYPHPSSDDRHASFVPASRTRIWLQVHRTGHPTSTWTTSDSRRAATNSFEHPCPTYRAVDPRLRECWSGPTAPARRGRSRSDSEHPARGHRFDTRPQ